MNSNELLSAIAAAAICVAATATGQPLLAIDILVRSGDAAPDGNGVYSAFENAVINETGCIAFNAGFVDTIGGLSDNEAVVLMTPNGAMVAARESDQSPDGNGIFSNFGAPSPLGTNSFSLVSSLQSTSGGSLDNTALIAVSMDSAAAVIAREGDASPDTNGAILRFDPPLATRSPCSVFAAQLRNTAGGFSDNSALFSACTDAPISIIARGGQTAPGTGGVFGEFQSYSMNSLGDVVFAAELSETLSNQAVFLNEQGSPLRKIAQEDDPAPGGDGILNRFGSPRINQSRTLAFAADLSLTSAGSENDHAIYVAEKNGPLTEVVREGAISPSGNGTVATFEFDELSINDADQLVVPVIYRGTSGGTLDNSGIVLYESGSIHSIAREGDASPTGDGEFASFRSPSLSNRGHTVFGASLRNTSASGSVSGLFISDSQGNVSEIARTGGPFDGGTILSIDFVNDEYGRNGQSADGSVVFSYVLTDLRNGLAIARIACRADLAPPFGVLDLSDIQAFITAFSIQSGVADLTGDGVLDLADIQAFIVEFSAGCQ